MIPKAISHYRILQPLGEGGMGEVYLAEDTVLNRKVAIKFLHPKSLSSAIARQRLMREAQAAASLDHPNICAIYEVGETEDACFIVMQYLEGETLDHKLLGSQLKLSDAIRFGAQIADALAEAHSHGVIHRDIKPQNLFITRRGQLKILDFGLAKVIPTEQAADNDANTLAMLSSPGSLIGTMPYMSPEQVRAEDLDSRSDLFSLGTVLYEILTGHQPFADRNRAVTLSAILTQEPPPLSRYIPNAPAELERILHKCLKKDREQRYQSARELAIDLRHLRRITSANSEAVDSSSVPEIRKGASYRWLAAMAALAVVIGAGIYFFARRGRMTDTPRQLSSIAVLPFVDTSGDPEMEYFSEGITDSLINSLSQLPNVKIIGRASVFRYKGRNVDAQLVGKELGVESVLTGRIVEHGNNLLISAELVDSRDNHHIWGAQYNRQVSEVITMQDDITRIITERLRLKLSGEDQKRLSKHYTENTQAYQLYLKGRYFWNKRTEQDIKKAIEYFQQAIDMDPNYALAYAGLADAYVSLGSSGFDAMLPQDAIPKARAAATKALEIDDALAEAHASLAYVKFIYDWDWPTAEREFNRALELNPNYPTAHQFRSLYFMAMGRQEEAIAESRRALELDPLSLSLHTNVGRALLFARRYDEAIDQLHKTIEMDPKYLGSHYLLGIAYNQKHLYREALDEIKNVKALSADSSFSAAAEGLSYAMAGRRSEALRIADELRSRLKKGKASPDYLAIVYAGLDDHEKTLDWLEQSYQRRTGQMVYLKVEPAFEKLQGDPRFQNLVRRVGL